MHIPATLPDVPSGKKGDGDVLWLCHPEGVRIEGTAAINRCDFDLPEAHGCGVRDGDTADNLRGRDTQYRRVQHIHGTCRAGSLAQELHGGPTGLEVVPGQGEGDRRVPIPGCWRDAADHGRVFFKKKAAVAENLREIFRVVLCILTALHKQNRAIRL